MSFSCLLIIVCSEFTGNDGAQAQIRAKEGFDMISVATDVDMIAKGFASQVAAASGDAGGSTVGSGYNAKN